MVNVGEGVIDWKRAIAKAKDVGIKYYFVEHDEPAVPVEAGVRASYNYVRNLRF
jgi:sugar phosphate isomerase/epimerase